MKTFLSAVLIALFFAAPLSYADAPKHCETIDVQVNGLVCDFCARALEKVFGKRDDVDSISVNLDEGMVKILLNEGRTIDNDTVTKLITDSGYNVVDIKSGC